MISEEDIQVKIELLCCGLKPTRLSNLLLHEQNPYHHRRTGNVGLQLLVGGSELVANVPFEDRFTHYSPYTLNKYNNEYYFFKSNQPICKCTPLPPPAWYTQKTSEGIPAGQILLQEGRSTLITAIYNRCDYAKEKEVCKFCAINLYAGKKYGITQKSAQQIAETVSFAIKEKNSCPVTLDLTGGNTLSPDNGAMMYVDVAKAVRKVTDIPICAEIAPPNENRYIDMLYDAGVDAFMMNLEIWDDKLRKLFMPGKSRISKARHFEAWEHALDLCGANKVSSVLIAGLESKFSTLRGAKRLISAGIIPTIVPFRPNDGTYLENFGLPSPDAVHYITVNVGEQLQAKGLSPQLHPGCINCTACSSEADYVRLFEAKAKRLSTE